MTKKKVTVMVCDGGWDIRESDRRSIAHAVACLLDRKEGSIEIEPIACVGAPLASWIPDRCTDCELVQKRNSTGNRRRRGIKREKPPLPEFFLVKDPEGTLTKRFVEAHLGENGVGVILTLSDGGMVHQVVGIEIQTKLI